MTDQTATPEPLDCTASNSTRLLTLELERIDEFVEAMRVKLHEKARAGFSGWDDMNPGRHRMKANNYHCEWGDSELQTRMLQAAEDEKYVNVANFAGMLWWRVKKSAEQANNALADAES